MEELSTRNELIKAITVQELSAPLTTTELRTNTYNKIPLSGIAALGVGFESVATSIQQIANNGQAVSGYYKVTIPAGTHLASFKDGSGFLGTAIGNSGIDSQARLNPVICDPTMMLMTITLANIDKKLDTVQEAQQEMLDFIVQKEKSALKGDLNFLIDVYNNYKYNWNNEKYKIANHIKALDIRQSAERKIDFYRERIKKQISKKIFLHNDRDSNKQLLKIQDEFKEYQLSMYIYGFSYFLEILLQENFNKDYLKAISQKLDDLSFQYRELYSLAYEQSEKHTESSLQTKFISGLSSVNKIAGETISKIPIINKSQIDETLIETSNRLVSYKDKKVSTIMSELLERQNACIRPFIDNIDMLNWVYNQTNTLIFDKENLYLENQSQYNLLT